MDKQDAIIYFNIRNNINETINIVERLPDSMAKEFIKDSLILTRSIVNNKLRLENEL